MVAKVFISGPGSVVGQGENRRLLGTGPSGRQTTQTAPWLVCTRGRGAMDRFPWRRATAHPVGLSTECPTNASSASAGSGHFVLKSTLLHFVTMANSVTATHSAGVVPAGTLKPSQPRKTLQRDFAKREKCRLEPSGSFQRDHRAPTLAQNIRRHR